MGISNMNSGTVVIARVTADRRIVVDETIPVGRQPKGLAIGDVDGDGKPDIVVAINGDDAAAILLAR